jgi:hypothetical protein
MFPMPGQDPMLDPMQDPMAADPMMVPPPEDPMAVLMPAAGPTQDSLGLPAGLGDLDAMMGLNDIDGTIVPVSAQGNPVQLAGEDLRVFMFRFRAMLESAITNMATVHDDARKDRMFYKMQAREQDYDGQPNITTPITANKTDGVIAHIRDAVEQRPLVAVSVDGVGRSAEEAAEVAPLIEAYVEREINRSGSREVITSHSIREAAVVGSAPTVLSVAVHENGEPFIQLEVIPLEDFFVDDINAKSLDDIGMAYRKRYRMYELDEMARENFIDQEAVDKIRKFISDRERPTNEEKDKHFNPDASLQEDMAPRTVYYGYMRYRPMGSPAATLYQVVYHRASQTPLALRPSPYADAFDGPNVELMRIGKVSDSLFGRGIPRRLASQQEMGDNAINNHLALNNLAANPPFQYRANSPFGKYLERVGRFGIRAGVGIPTMAQPDQGDVAMMKFENPGLNLTDVNLANQFASQATYTEEAIGATSAGRKTLGQFQVEVHKGTIRLRLDLADFAYDAARLLTKYYAMMCAYKIIPSGIVEIEESGKLLAAYDVPKDEVRQSVEASLVPMLMSGEIPPQDMAEVDAELWESLTHGRIPSAIRNDITISLSGTRIIADKIAELEMLNQLSAYILAPGMMEVLENDDYANFHIRSIIRQMGLDSIEKRIPQPPGRHMQPAARDAALAPFQQTFQRLSTV